ncbi:MAG: glycosyltransferase family 9 protein [Bacteroidia bacterium]
MKILIIRFSSIGDIVLTTPVIRCCKQQLNAGVHVVTKSAFRDVLRHNPYVDKLITFDKEVTEVLDLLKKENYDYVIDLHNNLRSYRVKLALGKKSSTFKKLNVQKWLAVNFKRNYTLPDVHIVQRYLKAAEPLGVKDDGKGLDYFLQESDHVDVNLIGPGLQNGFMALVTGGSYYTKKIPVNKLVEFCNLSKLPVVLLGGKEDCEVAQQVMAQTKHTFNTCGVYTINQSASILKQAACVVTSDTGLMHMAAAFGKIIYSVWGNTIPEFGMYPYKPHPASKLLEVKGLSCRPCSKLGYAACPKGHFKCMNEIEATAILKG